MLDRVDRVQLAVTDRRAAARTFADTLGAEIVHEDSVRVLDALRTTVQAGESEFELLEPAGDGPVAQHLADWREGIFAAGFSTPDLPALSARIQKAGIRFQEEGGQLFIGPGETRGMRMVISQSRARPRVGLISWLYEVTNIVEDHAEAASFYAEAFGLDQSRFSPIRSEEFGYTGTLTLFDPPARLDRIELTQITQPSLAMGRFFARRGPSVYMCFAETDNVSAVEERLRAREARYTPATREGGTIFIHPTALCGMLMGISVTNMAWTWSGRPELARA